MAWWDDIEGGATGQTGASGVWVTAHGGASGSVGSDDPWAGAHGGASGSSSVRGGVHGYVDDPFAGVQGDVAGRQQIFNLNDHLPGSPNPFDAPPGRDPKPPAQVSPYLLLGVVALVAVLALKK